MDSGRVIFESIRMQFVEVYIFLRHFSSFIEHHYHNEIIVEKPEFGACFVGFSSLKL